MASVVEKQQIALSPINSKGLGWTLAPDYGRLVFSSTGPSGRKGNWPASVNQTPAGRVRKLDRSLRTMSTVASPPPVRHGHCRLELRIGATLYRLRPMPAPPGFRSVWTLRKLDPNAA